MKTVVVIVALIAALAVPASADARSLSKQRAAQAIERFGSEICDEIDTCDHASVDRPIKDWCRRITGGRVVLCVLTYYGNNGIDCWTIAKARLSRSSSHITVTAGKVHCDYSDDE